MNPISIVGLRFPSLVQQCESRRATAGWELASYNLTPPELLPGVAVCCTQVDRREKRTSSLTYGGAARLVQQARNANRRAASKSTCDSDFAFVKRCAFTASFVQHRA